MTEETERVSIERRIDAIERFIADAQFAAANSDDVKTLKIILKIVKRDLKRMKKSMFVLPRDGGAEVESFGIKLIGILGDLIKASQFDYVGRKARLNVFIDEAKSERARLDGMLSEQKVGELFQKAKDGAAASLKKLTDAIGNGIESVKERLCVQAKQPDDE